MLFDIVKKNALVADEFSPVLISSIGVFKNFASFTGEHRCVPVKFAEFLRTPFFTKPPVAFLAPILCQSQQ